MAAFGSVPQAETGAPGDPGDPAPPGLAADAAHVYVEALEALNQAGVEFLVGGAYALAHYTGIFRDTKDLDIFLRPQHCEAALAVLAAAGFATEKTFPHWLAKAYRGDRYVDLIFSSGNAVAEVDDLWFVHSRPGPVLGVPVRLCPPEEIIWSKAFIMERERYDGADVAHLLLACGPELDWRRLLARFGRRWRVILSHLVLFGFVYPGEQGIIPETVMEHLLRRLERERARPPADRRLCDGTVLSRQQYLVDVTTRGYVDGRLVPRGDMTAADIAHWTAAIASSPVRPPRASVVRLNGRRASRARRRRR